MNGKLARLVAALGLICMGFFGWSAVSGGALAQEAVERREPPEPRAGAATQTVRRVLRGRLTFDRGEHEAVARLAEPVDVKKCVVTLSDAIVRDERDYGNPRDGAIVAELSETRLTVWTDEQHTRRVVSYQVIEYY